MAIVYGNKQIEYAGATKDNLPEGAIKINANSNEIATALTTLDNEKQAKVPGATEDNFATFNASGQVQDSLVPKASIPSISGTFNENEIPVKGSGDTFISSSKVFSIDETLAGDSDSNVPTEKAVKTYVDDITGTEQYTSELTNIASIFNVGSGTEGTYTTRDGVLDQEEYNGNTVVNIVSGESIADLGAVVFDSVIGNKYYDSLNNTIITATTTSTTATNNSGATADMMIIAMTGMYYENYTEAQMLALVQNGYIDGMQGTGYKKISSRDSSQNVIDYNYIRPLNQLPNTVADTYINGVESRNIQEYVLTEDDVTTFSTSPSNVDYAGIYLSVLVGAKSFTANVTGQLLADKYSEKPLTDLNASPLTSYLQNGTSLLFTFIKGTYASLAEAKTALAGTRILYQLATPIITKTNNSNLNTYSAGDIIVENKLNDVFLYGSGIDLSSYGYANITITQASILTPDGEQQLDTTDFTITSLVATNSNLNDYDLIWLEIEYTDGRTIPTSKFIYPLNLSGTLSTTVEKVTEIGQVTEKNNKEIDQLQANQNPFMEITKSGDDKGTVFTEQISVGKAGVGNGRELVAGGGDSYPVGSETGTLQLGSNWHCTVANTTGQTIVSATDITTILTSDNGSVTGLFNGTATGNYNLIGSDYPFKGVKAKIDTLGAVEPLNVVGERFASTGLGWVADSYMVTDADTPYTQKGTSLSSCSSCSEQWRFGFDPTDLSPVWEKVALTINGVVYTKYWARFRITSTITTDPIIEQLKLHTDRFEINADGATEYFGNGRYAKTILIEKHENTAKAPGSDNILIATDMTESRTGNQFNNSASDGFILSGVVPEGLDTSIPVQVIIDWHPNGAGTGDVELELDTVLAQVGFVYDGTATVVPQTPIITTVNNQDQELIRSTFLLDLSPALPGDKVYGSLYRDATTGNLDDTFADSISITGYQVIGYFWKP